MSVIFSWEDVAVRVGQLLEQGQFATNVELAECGTFEKRQLAEQLWYMSHDISEKAIEAGHMSIVRSLRGGFPEETEKLMVLLSEPESYQAIMRQVYAFRDACNTDKGMMRFHLPSVSMKPAESTMLIWRNCSRARNGCGMPHRAYLRHYRSCEATAISLRCSPSNRIMNTQRRYCP